MTERRGGMANTTTEAEWEASRQQRIKNRDDALADCRGRYYEFEPQHFERHYFNSSGYACAIVASIGHDDSWAAYIGGCPPQREEEGLKFVAAHGAKLSEADARHFFPFIELAYRH